MPVKVGDMNHPPLPARGCAFFFDFDGTLADLAPRPDAVVVEAATLAGLARLMQVQGGAVAVISGRPLAEIDAFVHPLRLPAAGVHGAERRGSDGALHRLPLPELGPARGLISEWVERHRGLLLEEKPGALALHYRAVPDLQEACIAVMQRAQAAVPGLDLLCGKSVVELKPRGASKGHAVRSFMAEPPFAHRQPWAFGDDVTDEAAFEAVLALGGIAIKVGAGTSLAPYRLPDPAALRNWLKEAAPE